MTTEAEFNQAMAALLRAVEVQYGPITDGYMLCNPQHVPAWERDRYSRRPSLRAAVRRVVERGRR